MIDFANSMNNPNVALRNVLLCAYAYYNLDTNLVSDYEYDTMFRYTKANRDKLTSKYKDVFVKYGCSDEGQSSSMLIPEDEYPEEIKRLAYSLCAA